MTLLAMSRDLLKLILSYLSLRELSSSTLVCSTFNRLIKEVLIDKALRGRKIPIEGLPLDILKTKLKNWEYYLLLKLIFLEVEQDSVK